MEWSWGIESAVAGLFGLLIGSFLNVVIYRLPRMLEQQWSAECAEHALQHHGACTCNAAAKQASSSPAFTLSRPRSSCPHCGHSIAWYENIPVFSFLALRGRCSQCHTPIRLRYPLVELATGALFAFCIAHWGFTPSGMAWCGFSAALLTLALIDWDTTLLPDSITLPLLWAGLLCSAWQWTAVPLMDAVYGAAAGYVSLWLVYWGFKLLTGKEGMGYGDFKLFAALGAWFGWQALIPIILMSSVIGAIVGVAMKFSSGLREGGYIPFGPFLSGAGFVSMALSTNTLLQGLFVLTGM